MEDVYKIVTDTSSYVNPLHRCVKVAKGDMIFISHIDGEEIFRAGAMYKNYNAMVSKVFKEPKRWWQFWKKPKVLGYNIIFL